MDRRVASEKGRSFEVVRRRSAKKSQSLDEGNAREIVENESELRKQQKQMGVREGRKMQ